VDYTLWLFGKSDEFGFTPPKPNLRMLNLLGQDFGEWLGMTPKGSSSELSRNSPSRPSIDPPEPPIPFAEMIKVQIDVTLDRGRSVWLIFEPLERFKIFGVSSSEVSHWAILVSPLTRVRLGALKRGSQSSSSADSWGTRHELRNNGGQNQYTGGDPYYASSLKPGSSLTYLGQTEMSDEELQDYGISTSDYLMAQAVK
jgi:hypothetical protein